MTDEPIDAIWVVAALEDAMITLLALPPGGYSTRLAQGRHDVLQDLDEEGDKDEGGKSIRIRPAVPSAAKVTAMDEILSWLAYIPNRPIRRIVALRSYTHRGSGKPKSWRSIAEIVNADYRTVQAWHGRGIDLIVAALKVPRRLPPISGSPSSAASPAGEGLPRSCVR